jgi:hypothetical protein
MGETANKKLNVIIVGIITTTRASVLSIAPKPTVIPPKQPTKVKISAIKPKRLNSRFFIKSDCTAGVCAITRGIKLIFTLLNYVPLQLKKMT